MDELIKIVEEGFEAEKTRIRAKVEEGFESAKMSMVTKIKRYLEDGNPVSSPTNMKLEFRNWIARRILTGDEIKGEGGLPIEVALVDDSTGDVIIAGPEASADVEIVLLKGKFQGDEGFNSNIIPEVKGKPPILAGNLPLQLQNGVAVMNNIKIRNHAIKIKPSKFMLGARVVGDSRIKEAKTEPFILKEYRAKYKEKHKHPSLADEVWRLDRIYRGGKIDKRLQDNKIFTVEEFLIQLLINPLGLKNIVDCRGKKWEAIVSNARACLIGERVYFYMDLEQNIGIIFDILGKVIGLYPESYYSQTSTLSEKQKADLLASAYANWREVKAFDDQTSLQQHLASLTAFTAEESSSKMNLFGENGDRDLESFENNEIDVVYDAVMQLRHAYPCSPSLFDCINTNAAAAEPSRLSSSGAKRWRKLFCILTWVIKKEESEDVSPRRKKRRHSHSPTIVDLVM